MIPRIGLLRPAILAIACLALAAPAFAQVGADAEGRLTVTGDDARLIAQVAQRVGDTDFAEDVIGTPSIAVHRDDGSVWFSGAFIGCESGLKCQALALSADFGNLGVTSEQLNAFNGEYFFVRAYRNGSNSVIVQQDISLIHGVNDEWLFQGIATFGQLVDIFAEWAALSRVDAMIDSPVKPKPS